MILLLLSSRSSQTSALVRFYASAPVNNNELYYSGNKFINEERGMNRHNFISGEKVRDCDARFHSKSSGGRPRI